ncbi:NAD/NADP-dependent octopine/nopaline dehydrogenase family protein [uncultured Cloacibacillus sp.]|uniref:NAD/NADP-dependent octopine/nopaline dehydrogenase family protein n=1 Tax=uncultured Cloacibacillus sp. TaxID=889794 RepID=UPI0026DA7D8F|nr:NAD/NADP-dependent octopine/nopaline dehydrogenase family protein [uncultured Cloacibacillus sp.]
MATSVTVIGAGNGGTAIAAYMASQGAELTLCDPFPEYLDGIEQAGGIELTQDEKTQFIPLDRITTDVAKAIIGAQLIMVVTPAFTHQMIASACSLSLVDDQIIVLNPGRTGGALAFLETVRNNGCSAKIIVAEAQTLIYACRKTGVASVEIYGVKNNVDLGVIPAKRTKDALDLIHQFYPQFVAAENSFETSMSNIGALFHPTPILLNIGRIENDTNGFRYYIDGITPSVAVLIKAVDSERMAVAKAYGVKVNSVEEWLNRAYGIEIGDLYYMLQHNDAYYEIMAPHNIEVRYVTEDVPMSLVPISELGKLAYVQTPNIDSIIQLASSIYGRDFRLHGRNSQSLGLDGMNKMQIARYFEIGEKQ